MTERDLLATVLNERTFGCEVELRADEGDGRTVSGRIVPYNTPTNLWGNVFERFKPGSLTKTVRERGGGVELRLTHGGGPIGRAVEWEDRDDGMHAVFRVSDIQRGNEALTLLRDKVLHAFSIGFIPVSNRTQILEEEKRVTYERGEVKLDHVALVSHPAYKAARVLAVREFQPERDAPALARLRAAREERAARVAALLSSG